MSQSNPMLQNPERASYELAYLLRDLPRHLNTKPLTVEQKQMVAAADMQALNYSETLLHGLESIGRVLWVASASKTNDIEARDVGSIGTLVTEMAVQLQFLGEFRSSISDYNDQQKGTSK